MAPSDFANANIDEVVDKLTHEEAILLTAGVGFWHTHAIPRLDIPAVKVSDGPNGIRGNFFFMGTPAKCLPCATALGATWDPELVQEVGLELLAGEAKLRSASIALAPTCNIQRVRLLRFIHDAWAHAYRLGRTLSAAALSSPSPKIRFCLA
jgi:beta-glucosidase